MRNITRVLVGLVGLFNIVVGLGFLIQPAQAALSFFLMRLGTQGMATLRADFTSFFVTGGLFAVAAAWRGQRSLLLVPLALLSVALAGRAVSLLADGMPATAYPPMMIEALMISLLALGWSRFGADDATLSPARAAG